LGVGIGFESGGHLTEMERVGASRLGTWDSMDWSHPTKLRCYCFKFLLVTWCWWVRFCLYC